MLNKKLMIFFIDGGTWNLLDPWITDNQLPNFKRFITGGVTGVMQSTIPPFTVPAIQSFHTGKNPGNLGIFSIFKEDGSIISFNDVHEKAIWEVLGENGFKSLVVELPTTYPIRPFNGVMISGFLTPSKESEFTYPPELKTKLEDYPAGVEYGESDLNSIDVKDLSRIFNSIVEISKKRFSVFSELFQKENPNFSILYVKSTDVLGHLFWDKKEYLLEYYKMLDDQLGQVSKMAGDDANILVISDHGFEDADKYSFNVNSWLASEGYFPQEPSFKYRIYAWLDRHKTIKKIIKKLMIKAGNDLSESKTALQKSISKAASAHFDIMYSSGIRISDDALVQSPGIADEIIMKLRNLTYKGGKVFKIVEKREVVYSGPYAKKAPDIILLPAKEFSIYGGMTREIFGQIKNKVRKGAHGAAIEAIFLAMGPDVTHKPGRIQLNILDIFPTILGIFGITNVKCDGKIIALK